MFYHVLLIIIGMIMAISPNPNNNVGTQVDAGLEPILNQQDKVKVLTNEQRDVLFYDKESSAVTDGFKIAPNTVPTCYSLNYNVLSNAPEEDNSGYWGGFSITTHNFDNIIEQAYDAAEQEVMTPAFWDTVISGMGATNNPFVQDIETVDISVASGNPTWTDRWRTVVTRDDEGEKTIFGPSYYGDHRLSLINNEPLIMTFDMTWFDDRVFRITGHLDSYRLSLEHYSDVSGTHKFEDADTSFASNVLAGSGKDLFYGLSLRSDLEEAGMNSDLGRVIGIETPFPAPQR